MKLFWLKIENKKENWKICRKLSGKMIRKYLNLSVGRFVFCLAPPFFFFKKLRTSVVNKIFDRLNKGNFNKASKPRGTSLAVFLWYGTFIISGSLQVSKFKFST